MLLFILKIFVYIGGYLGNLFVFEFLLLLRLNDVVIKVYNICIYVFFFCCEIKVLNLYLFLVIWYYGLSKKINVGFLFCNLILWFYVNYVILLIGRILLWLREKFLFFERKFLCCKCLFLVI